MVLNLFFHVQGIGHDHDTAGFEYPPVADNGLRCVGKHDSHLVTLAQSGCAQIGGQIIAELPKIVIDDKS